STSHASYLFSVPFPVRFPGLSALPPSVPPSAGQKWYCLRTLPVWLPCHSPLPLTRRDASRSTALALRPCPAALPCGLALRPCPAALPCGLALRPCPADSPCGLALRTCPAEAHQRPGRLPHRDARKPRRGPRPCQPARNGTGGPRRSR